MALRYFRFGLAGALALAAVCAVGCGPVSRASSAAPVAGLEPNPFAADARDVLVAHCGSCHRPGLPTSDPRALAVFDLEQPRWYGTLTRSQLDAMTRRVRGSDALSDRERGLVERFVGCARDGACG